MRRKQDLAAASMIKTLRFLFVVNSISMAMWLSKTQQFKLHNTNMKVTKIRREKIQSGILQLAQGINSESLEMKQKHEQQGRQDSNDHWKVWRERQLQSHTVLYSILYS